MRDELAERRQRLRQREEDIQWAARRGESLATLRDWLSLIVFVALIALLVSGIGQQFLDWWFGVWGA